MKIKGNMNLIGKEKKTNKIFDNLNYGTWFTDEFGTRWLKLNLKPSWHNELPSYRGADYCDMRVFNAVDYNGLMAYIPFDLPVVEIIDLFSPQTQGLDNIQTPDIINTQLDNTNTNTNNNSMTTVTNTAVSTVPQVTLREAVVSAVGELKSKGSFSIHDVTLSVRAAANGGEIALPGLEAQPNQSGIKYWINNEDVKRVMNTLESDGTLANAGLVNVDYSGPYRLYQFNDPVASANDATAGVVDPATVTTAANPAQSPLEARIEAYLTNIGTATLKQVQSALKVNGVTCKDLATIVAGLGYTVTPGTTDCFSTYVVS